MGCLNTLGLLALALATSCTYAQVTIPLVTYNEDASCSTGEVFDTASLACASCPEVRALCAALNVLCAVRGLTALPLMIPALPCAYVWLNGLL